MTSDMPQNKFKNIDFHEFSEYGKHIEHLDHSLKIFFVLAVNTSNMAMSCSVIQLQ